MRFLPLVASVLVVLPGCFIVGSDPPPDPFGNFAFDWSFAGESDCGAANVDNLNVILSQGGEVVFERDAEPCFGGGLTITDIDSGSYDVDVVAFDHNGNAAYEATFPVDIPDGHATANVGLVTLDALGDAPPPPPSQGTLSFFWAFRYPVDGTVVEDCLLAGVDSVDVIVTPDGPSGVPFQQTSSCDSTHQGLDIAKLNEGRYTLRLQGHGSYNGQDVMLYDSGDIVADVVADQRNDLGNIDMGRVATSFSDFNIAWTFSDTDCASLGAQSVTLSFERDGFASPEDVFDVDCSAASVVRRTFVPGHYTVTGVAHGTSSTYRASVPVDLAPNSVAEVDLALAPG